MPPCVFLMVALWNGEGEVKGHRPPFSVWRPLTRNNPTGLAPKVFSHSMLGWDVSHMGLESKNKIPTWRVQSLRMAKLFISRLIP